MKEILVLGGGASGLAAAIAAAQTGGGRVRVTLLEQNPAPGKKLLATGNGRCNFDNLASSAPGCWPPSTGRTCPPGGRSWACSTGPMRQGGCIPIPTRRRT